MTFSVFLPPLPLSQLFAKLQAVKSEIQDIQDSHIKERQDLEQTQNELTRELKLKYGLCLTSSGPFELCIRIPRYFMQL